ncbi:MAG: Glu/Leu/Phe/Val dehydrogenase dimerization domain-containing protein [Bacillota bacterium]|jgi:leucine dehydrogenase
MEVFVGMQKHGFEQVVFCYNESAGLKAIIAIHDTTLGPALGGLRMWPYATEEDAVFDVLRLARGMTYKAAAAGLNLGGGKAVIIADPRRDKSEALFRAFGRFVQSLGGRYITAEDVGTTVEDMDYIHMETDYVTGVSTAYGSSGDPSPATAFGVWRGMKACAKEAFGSESLAGKRVAIQGVGHVGQNLARHLYDEGARLVVSDINEEAVARARAEFRAEAVDPEAIYDVECDIFSPCALGAVLNPETIPRLKTRVVAGAANNQLLSDSDGDTLHERGILYAPDYVINAGGLINVADELEGYNRDRAFKKITGIYANIEKVIGISKRDRIPTYRAADRLAEERIGLIGQQKRMHLPCCDAPA